MAAGCASNGSEIFWVGRHDEIAASQRPFCDTRVDNVRCACLCGESADGTRSAIIEHLDIATTKELGK